MRIALFSDIHGNAIALDAVLADIERHGGVDAYWVLGDLVAIGPDPLGVLERLANLPNTYYLRGNTERYTITDELPFPTLADAAADPRLLPLVVRVAQSFAWTRGAGAAAGWLPWLSALPSEQRLTLPGGARLLGVHAAPGTDDGDGIHPAQSDDELQALLAGCGAEIICVGHTHWPVDRSVAGMRVINLGSVSNPFPPDLRASYVLLDADASGYRLRHLRADYDREVVIEQAQRVGHPGADYITGFLRGTHRPRWMQLTGPA
jgi:predicted phosphodiesterase